MKHELWYSVVVRDRQGKVVSRERRRSRSFLKQWNQVVYVQMAQVSNYEIKDRGGTIRDVDKHEASFRMTAAAGTYYSGISVGTGDTPVAIDDHVLETPITEGTGAGQMEYLICTVAEYVVAAPSCSFVVSRTIANNSPAEITVKEAVLYIMMQSFSGCGIRDVFDTPQAVPIGGSITIDWAIQVTA